jgi:hypothetical protein
MCATQSLRDCLAFDFPPEVFLQRSEVFKALLDLLEGNQEGSSQLSAAAYTNLAQQALLVLVRRFANVYKYLGSNLNKISQAQSHRFAHISSEGNTPEYIKGSYPTSVDALWNREEALQE